MIQNLTMPAPLVSFVMPAYKGLWIRKAIDSILAQTYQNIELIIVDDVSPEDLYSIVSSYEDGRIRYHRNSENLGGTSLIRQWEHSLTFAKGEYVVMAADDDVYHPQFTEQAINMVIKYPKCDIVRSRVAQIDEQGALVGIDQAFPAYMSQIEYAFRYRDGSAFICMGNFLFRTEALRRKGFVDFPCALCSDIATSIDLARNGMANVDRMLFYFRQSDVHLSGSTVRNREKMEAITLFFDWIARYHFETPKNDFERYYMAQMQAYDWHEKCIYDYFNQVIRTASFSQLSEFLSLARRATTREKMMMLLRWCKRKMLH